MLRHDEKDNFSGSCAAMGLFSKEAISKRTTVTVTGITDKGLVFSRNRET